MSSCYILFLITVLCLSKFIKGDNFTCYQCYYSIEQLGKDWNRPECMNSPATPGVSVISRCRESYFCFVQETYDLQKSQIKEFSRSCLAVGYETGCTKDTYNIVCRTTCKGNLCTGNVTANLHELYFKNRANLISILHIRSYLICFILSLFFVI